MSSRNGPTRRLGSPPGGSILTTSAPRSPKSLPQNWPFSSASSRTLRAASGPDRDWASLTGASPPCTESAPASPPSTCRRRSPHRHPRGCTPTGRRPAPRQFVFTQCHAPSFDLLVQFLLVLQASGDGGEFRRGGP